VILALKTDGATTEAQLFLDSPLHEPTPTDPAATLTWESGRQLADQLLTRLTGFLSEHGTQLADLTGIVIFSGPGSFTSLRIGHTTANALADSLNIPVVGSAGPNWLAEGIAAIKQAKPGRPALPHYGAEAHITRPKA
jgi:tRNA threonylcarbamoyladenosine biosynthesis protein TsaB